MKLLFIDESKAKDFLLCVVEIDFNDVAFARRITGEVRKKGQSTVHFVSEKDSRKREILSQYKKIGFRCTNFMSSNKLEIPARQACLEALILSLRPQQQYLITIDRDESNVRRDKLVFIKTLPENPECEVLQYRHEEPSQERLLWIPDAIAWASAKGGKWRTSMADFDIQTVRVD